MPVVPYRTERVENSAQVSRFLEQCLQQVHHEQQTKLACFAVAANPVDLWAVLDRLSARGQCHFYFENPARQQAMLAFAPCDGLSDQWEFGQLARWRPGDRFSQASQWIENWRRHTLVANFNRVDWPLTGPYFFCGFPFFAAQPHERSQRQAPMLPMQTANPVGSHGSMPEVMLPQVLINRQGQQYRVVFNLRLSPGDRLADQLALIQSHLRQLPYLSAEDDTLWRLPRQSARLNKTAIARQSPTAEDATEGFRSQVLAALAEIEAGRLDKVVLAHQQVVKTASAAQLTAALGNLHRHYPDCYIFSIGQGRQTFVGASPERLLSISGTQLVSDALAGSAPRGSSPQADAALADELWHSPKERHEHQMVVAFIAQALSELGLSPKYCTQPGLLKLANIQHLHTPIRAQVKAQTPTLKILSKLHPTPAVAGVPGDRACNFIQQHEPFERSRYAAPLGWIDHQGNCEFVVGIRSALLETAQATLYAGAGIVAGSDPDREAAEIQLKLNALLAALEAG
ncbi:MAG: isochorismate synthase [Cyanobacteria bacterium P01_D01_bin.128]